MKPKEEMSNYEKWCEQWQYKNQEISEINFCCYIFCADTHNPALSSRKLNCREFPLIFLNVSYILYQLYYFQTSLICFCSLRSQQLLFHFLIFSKDIT